MSRQAVRESKVRELRAVADKYQIFGKRRLLQQAERLAVIDARKALETKTGEERAQLQAALDSGKRLAGEPAEMQAAAKEALAHGEDTKVIDAKRLFEPPPKAGGAVAASKPGEVYQADNIDMSS